MAERRDPFEDLIKIEKRCTMESQIFLVEKRDKSIQGRAFANGTSSQREYMERDKVASPTHHHDGISYDNSND